MKTPSNINNPSNDDFMDIVKKTWEQLSAPKPALELFVKEYYDFEKELYYFLNSNVFYLESENTTISSASIETKKSELTKINELIEKLRGIICRSCPKNYRQNNQIYRKINFYNAHSDRNYRQRNRFYRKGDKYYR